MKVVKTCSKCGSEIEEKWDFCKYCGNNLKENNTNSNQNEKQVDEKKENTTSTTTRKTNSIANFLSNIAF